MSRTSSAENMISPGKNSHVHKFRFEGKEVKNNDSNLLAESKSTIEKLSCIGDPSLDLTSTSDVSFNGSISQNDCDKNKFDSRSDFQSSGKKQLTPDLSLVKPSLVFSQYEKDPSLDLTPERPLPESKISHHTKQKRMPNNVITQEEQTDNLSSPRRVKFKSLTNESKISVGEDSSWDDDIVTSPASSNLIVSLDAIASRAEAALNSAKNIYAWPEKNTHMQSKRVKYKTARRRSASLQTSLLSLSSSHSQTKSNASRSEGVNFPSRMFTSKPGNQGDKKMNKKTPRKARVRLSRSKTDSNIATVDDDAELNSVTYLTTDDSMLPNVLQNPKMNSCQMLLDRIEDLSVQDNFDIDRAIKEKLENSQQTRHLINKKVSKKVNVSENMFSNLVQLEVTQDDLLRFIPKIPKRTTSNNTEITDEKKFSPAYEKFKPNLMTFWDDFRELCCPQPSRTSSLSSEYYEDSIKMMHEDILMKEKEFSRSRLTSDHVRDLCRRINLMEDTIHPTIKNDS